MAFQKWTGLPSTTVVDEATAAKLNRHAVPPEPGRDRARAT